LTLNDPVLGQFNLAIRCGAPVVLLLIGFERKKRMLNYFVRHLFVTTAFINGTPLFAQTVDLEPGHWVFEQSVMTTSSSGEDVRNATEVSECLTEGNTTWSAQSLIDEYFSGGGLRCSFVHVDIDQGAGQADFTCQNAQVGAMVRGSSVGSFTGETYTVRTTGTLTSTTLSYDFLVSVVGRRVGNC